MTLIHTAATVVAFALVVVCPLVLAVVLRNERRRLNACTSCEVVGAHAFATATFFAGVELAFEDMERNSQLDYALAYGRALLAGRIIPIGA